MERPEKVLCLNKAAKGFLLGLSCFFVLQGLFGEMVWAKAVPPGLAHKMVNGWLAKEAKPMGSRLGSDVERVETFADANGQAVYYVVYLRPNGFVIVPAELAAHGLRFLSQPSVYHLMCQTRRDGLCPYYFTTQPLQHEKTQQRQQETPDRFI